MLRRIGGFRGFGGPWLGRPRVVAGGPTGCAVTADGVRWAIVADIHGSAVTRLADEDSVPPTVTVAVTLPVPWADTVTGAVPASVGSPVLVVSRRHSYQVDAVRPAA